MANVKIRSSHGAITAPSPKELKDQILPRHVQLLCPKLRLNMQILLGEGAPNLIEGLGGYTAQERAGDVAVSRWPGTTMLKMSVPLVLNGWKSRESQQQRYVNIRSLGRNPKDPGVAPPPFVLNGPLPVSGKKWVCEVIEFGEAERNGDGILLYQPFVLVCQEWVNPDDVKIYNKPRKKSKDKGIPGPLLAKYTVKKGDTLRSIAAQFYDDGDEWKAIAKVNDIRDPNSVKPGEVLKIPEQ